MSQDKDCIDTVDNLRWRLDKNIALRNPTERDNDRTWSDRGGYVNDFEFDSSIIWSHLMDGIIGPFVSLEFTLF